MNDDKPVTHTIQPLQMTSLLPTQYNLSSTATHFQVREKKLWIHMWQMLSVTRYTLVYYPSVLSRLLLHLTLQLPL